MADLYHEVGSDAVVAANSDLLTADGIDQSRQAILRRLMTNPAVYDNDGNVLIPGDYIFHPDYGAGLPRYIGNPYTVAGLKALIQEQMFLEETVDQKTPPTITVTPITNGVSLTIQYVYAPTGTPVTLKFDV